MWATLGGLLLLPVVSQVYLKFRFSPTGYQKSLEKEWRKRCDALHQLLTDAAKSSPEFLESRRVQQILRRIDGALCQYKEGQAVAWTHPDVPPLQPAASNSIQLIHYQGRDLLAMSRGGWFGFLRLGLGSPEETGDTVNIAEGGSNKIFFQGMSKPGFIPFRWNDTTLFYYKSSAPSNRFSFSEKLLFLWWLALAFCVGLGPWRVALGVWVFMALCFAYRLDTTLFGIAPLQSALCGPQVVAVGYLVPSAMALWTLAIWSITGVFRIYPRFYNTIFYPLIKKGKSAYEGLIPFLGIPLTAVVFTIVADTVKNSSVSLNPGELPAWAWQSYLLFGSLLILVLSWHKIMVISLRPILPLDPKQWLWILAWTAGGFLISRFVGNWKTAAFSSMTVILCALVEFYARRQFREWNSLMSAAVVALPMGLQMLWARHENMLDFMRLRTSEVSAIVDPDVDYLFRSLQEKLQPSEGPLTLREINLILRRLKASYRQRYSIRAAVFDARLHTPLLSDESGLLDYEYFQNRITASGQATGTPGLFKIFRPGMGTFYVGRIALKSPIQPRVVMIECVPRHTALYFHASSLRAHTAHAGPSFSEYSYALYHGNQLVENAGRFDYATLFPTEKLGGCKGEMVLRNGGHWHLISCAQEGHVVVISTPADNAYAVFSHFTLVFLLVLGLAGLSSLLRTMPLGQWKVHITAFRTRVRLLIFGLLTFFFLFSLIGTLYFLDQKFEEKNQTLLREKMAAVLMDLEDNLEGKILDPSQEKQFLDFELTRVSELIFADINFFSRSGKFLSSSNPALLEEGLVMPLIPPTVMKKLKGAGISVLINREEAANLSFMAGYGAVVDNRKNVIGYVQVPFIARQRQYEAELSATINTLFNAYAAALTLMLTLSIFLIHSATGPLIKLSEKIRSLRYGTRGERIDYPGLDEIGQLVQEYNRLAEELDKSARELARRERESAWKDVARQVAHEIKNPLTPMKLGIQYLEKAWQQDKEKFGERLASFRAMLISQIEALDRIASDFSAYAQLGEPRPEKVSVKHLVDSVCSLFSENEKNVRVHCSIEGEDLCIYADREHVLRILNNLVKNSIQAIPDDKAGEVYIHVRRENQHVLIAVKDNGVGIPLEEQEKIFTPYFTTKTGGMGIGLSMSKNLVETNGGRIWFHSEPGQGATFYVSLPSD
ncbi:MAG: ATP-binding protein [Flavobacteriales bacterium]|nr:ATP-binding protein [Flavobacteriales bacterium]MDW8409472.1 ATP-binding protein [Flavobacteriales bacterium]